MLFDIQILETPLSVQDCTTFVTDESCGAIDVFIGTVRNQTKGKKVEYLDFEAYKSMAIKEMQKIAEATSAKWPVAKIAMHHRVGKLKLKELAVVIAISTPHRQASFEACKFCIDQLKETVPIWKKEVFEDGEVWVAAHP
ncbi:MAG: molybdenum cofactor biosynthesis protein MoaE [Bacteroidetes bacterium]|nr:molybdenum cofactor biosynthesis protein MoaE [Bacteroidota bacterium]